MLPYHRGLTRRRDGLVQLGTGRDMGIDHQQVQTLVAVLLMHCGDKHTLGVDTHTTVYETPCAGIFSLRSTLNTWKFSRFLLIYH